MWLDLQNFNFFFSSKGNKKCRVTWSMPLFGGIRWYRYWRGCMKCCCGYLPSHRARIDVAWLHNMQQIIHKIRNELLPSKRPLYATIFSLIDCQTIIIHIKRVWRRGRGWRRVNDPHKTRWIVIIGSKWRKMERYDRLSAIGGRGEMV